MLADEEILSAILMDEALVCKNVRGLVMVTVLFEAPFRNAVVEGLVKGALNCVENVFLLIFTVVVLPPDIAPGGDVTADLFDGDFADIGLN